LKITPNFTGLLKKDIQPENERSNFSNYTDDSCNKPSYEKYNAYNAWDNFTIDEAFNGDPDATWNVD
jgi:hypothetical protein